MAITPQRVLHDYLLLALEALGGSASKRSALNWMDEHFGSTFTGEDRQSQPTRNEAKWENQTAWERDSMVRAGLLAPFEAGTTLRGQWTLTPLGRSIASRLTAAIASSSSDAGFTTGQAPLLDAQRRKNIEDAAQERLMDEYRARGWEVVDTRVGHPYDARAIKGDAVTYLEAKGTTSQGESVIVTRNEVAWAREHPNECVLGILANVRLDLEGIVVDGSGELRIFKWYPDPEELVAIQYNWQPSLSQLLPTQT
ncbi:hypothetical protein ABIB25_005581 [Nakamurella sp. UYEF19]|uniref:protein NO VEIN domain-containing protein n=1 Tax=Nakamurella sp. UYEF19 TaxID=1756392 RepID=UPI003397E889